MRTYHPALRYSLLIMYSWYRQYTKNNEIAARDCKCMGGHSIASMAMENHKKEKSDTNKKRGLRTELKRD